MKSFQSLSYFLLSFCLLGAASQRINAQSDYVPPTLPSIPDKIFNIKDYGAISDSTTDNTKAFQDAINAAGNAGGGRVVVTRGTYLCGPLQFISNLNSCP